MDGLSKIDLGGFEVELLSDGVFRLDGGAMFGITPKSVWKNFSPPDEKNRILLGLNVLLIRRENCVILVEAGIGSHYPEKFSQIFCIEQRSTLIEELEKRGIGRDDVDVLILTHLHFDHSGWATCWNGEGFEVTFPKAHIYLQKAHWEESLHPHRSVVASFLEPRLSPLRNFPHLHLMEGNGLIQEGIEVRLTEGHTEGHQSILVHGSQESLCYTGDLIPTASHLPRYHVMAYDRFPEKNFANKIQLMDEACENKWRMVFPHEPEKNLQTLRLSIDNEYILE